MNTSGCFKGVGFNFKAAPNSGLGNGPNTHANYAGLSYQLWAYGAPLTDAGEDNLNTGVSKFSEDHYTILVDGLGQWQTQYGVTEPFYSRLTAFATSSHYVYIAADATNAYPRKLDYAAGGSGGYDYIEAPLAHLQKVQRHFLFVKNKYFIVYDDLQASRPSTFSSLYHVPFVYGDLDSANKASSQQDLLDLNKGNASFTYTSSNVPPYDIYFDTQRPAFTKVLVPVQVQVINSPSTLRIDDMKGDTPGNNTHTNPIPHRHLSLVDPATGRYDFIVGLKDWLSSRSFYHRAHSLWFSNATPQTNFHFMTVIYPKNPAIAREATIERINDFTARITDQEGNVDVISFNPAVAPPDTTLLIDLSDLTPLPVIDDITGTTVTSVPYVPPADGAENGFCSTTSINVCTSGDLPKVQLRTRPLRHIGHVREVVAAQPHPAPSL